MNQRALVPDFRMPPWRYHSSLNNKIDHPSRPGQKIWVGHFNVYFNERTSELGHEVIIATYRSANLTCWERKIFVGRKEKTLCYVGIHQQGNWKIYRVTDTIGKFGVDLSKSGGVQNITVTYKLVIGEPLEFKFAYLNM